VSNEFFARLPVEVTRFITGFTRVNFSVAARWLIGTRSANDLRAIAITRRCARRTFADDRIARRIENDVAIARLAGIEFAVTTFDFGRTFGSVKPHAVDAANERSRRTVSDL
jgi:hypothetical protein